MCFWSASKDTTEMPFILIQVTQRGMRANLWKCHSNVLMIEVQELPSAGGTDTVKQIHAACVCVYARVKLKLAKAAQLN